MNKSGIVLLSAIGTLGIVAGSVGVVNAIPQTKGKLNVSFGDTTLIGKNQENLEVVNPSTDSFQSELEKINHVMINYINREEMTSSILPKGSMLEMLENETSEKTFIGWSREENSNKLVLSADESMDLYPVYTTYLENLSFHSTNKYHTFAQVGYVPSPVLGDISKTLGNRLINKYSNGEFTGYIIGFSESSDSIVPVTEFSAEKEYYAIFYCENENKVMSYDEYNDANENFRYGGYAFKDINLHTLSGISVVKAREVLGLHNGGSFVYNGYEYTLAGYSISSDSIETIDRWNPIDYSTVDNLYAVYNGPNGKVNISTLPEIDLIKVNLAGGGPTFKDYIEKLVSHTDLSTYSHIITVDGATIGNTLTLVGYSTSAWSGATIADENLTAEYFAENNITQLYGVYQISDSTELMSAGGLNSMLVNASFPQLVSYCYLSSAGTKVTHTTWKASVCQTNVTYNDVVYTFDHWAPDDSTTGTVATFEAGCTYYAVYTNANGEFKTINDIING